MSEYGIFLLVIFLGISACQPSISLKEAASSNSAIIKYDKDPSIEISPENTLPVLKSYFDALNGGDYEEAANIYGGDFTPLFEYNPDITQDEKAALFASTCELNGFLCDLHIGEIMQFEKVSDLAIQFTLTLEGSDGSSFELGPCCGEDPASASPQYEFVYTVAWQGGRFQVMELPVYRP